jgi:hypothetical protein
MRKGSIFSIALLATAGLCHGNAILTTQANSCLDTSAPGACKGGSGTLTDGGNSETYAVSASSLFGILHVSASSTFNVTNGWALALGFVSFKDDITITSPTHANGTTGSLTVDYFIDGTNSTTNTGGNGGNAFLQVSVEKRTTADVFVSGYTHDFNGSSVSGTFAATPITFTYGTAFELYVSMQATAGSIIDSGVGYTFPNVTGSGSGASNFFNTLVVNGLQTGDGDDTFSATGGAYTASGVVPEPGTFALVGLVIPAVLWGRRRACAGAIRRF